MSGAANPESEGVVSKVKVKKQIKTIVQDLENVLGDLKDVAKELKEVVDEIDTLTSSLRLEEEMTDSSKTDTLNSSSSSTTTTTTASSMEKIKPHPDECLCHPPPPPSLNPGVLTVLRKPHPPPPPPRLTPLRPDEHTHTLTRSRSPGRKPNGTLMRNGVFPGKPTALHNLDSCCPPRPIPVDNSKALVPVVPPPVPMLLSRHDKSRCLQSSAVASNAVVATAATTRERVRFSETVQYHGYCPDCDLQYELDHTDLHLHDELVEEQVSPTHRCCSSPSSPPLPLENGGLTTSHSFPPSGPMPPPCTPHSSTLKPAKTILRKSTTTTV
ncbi:protein Largen [Alosa sapidissima]|uniref:protein Largen n=1 Tax=Alosa sapidissima TaxID=34773 RepID=UPI001C091D25|nr:protein Largen [Alosa sapidissima]